MRTTALIATAILFAAQTARADDFLGSHALSGRKAGVAFTGTIEFREDATFKGERRPAEGETEPLAGEVGFDKETLVLRFNQGIRGNLPGASPQIEKRFVRAEREKRVVWRHKDGDDLFEIDSGKAERRIEVFVRALDEGRVANWIFNGNKGVVDGDPDRKIIRSKEPNPQEIVRLARVKGVKTILSLNGELDKEVLVIPSAGDSATQPEKVNLKKLIADEGLRHETFALSARSAPTDEELVQIFKVLLDDSKKPILLHCLGGADRTGIIAALYQVEFLGLSKAEAKKTMREHLWLAYRGTEIQGAYLDMYQRGHLTKLLEKAGVKLPMR